MAYGHSVVDWTLSEWGCALSGEVGELCNKIKKKRQGQDITHKQLTDELADIVIYCDLLATKLGYRLEDIVRDKFNRTSDKIDSDIKI